ncbi:hypothetical protein Pint_11005 [Pistacia integerrima]|uniref:Uncharacterized protein n=1 Tax=Pistacia integerrima TaxID=434235 RepID=A0ACC0XHS6_9ROSI|nr:hypothetical protein Pint_11005 [Pistacia integerrima]
MDKANVSSVDPQLILSCIFLLSPSLGFIFLGWVFDLHRHNMDHITIPSSRRPEFGVLRHVEDVFDCWFESGSMPYAYIHYPFENVKLFEKNFPGNFVVPYALCFSIFLDL